MTVFSSPFQNPFKGAFLDTQSFLGDDPSLKFRLFNGSSLNSAVSEARTGNVYTFDQNGDLYQVPTLTPAKSWDPLTGEFLGLLIEPEATNLVSYSEDFTQGWWDKTDMTISTSSETAPLPSASASLLTMGTSGNSSLFVNSSVVTTTEAHTCSFFVKKGNTRWVRVATDQASVWFDADNDFAVGTQQSNATDVHVQKLKNGWYRLGVTITSDGTIKSGLWVADGDGLTTEPSGGTVHAFGAQIEVGSKMTSYIPTDGGTATRQNTSLTLDYDLDTDYTVYTEYKALDRANGTSQRIYSINNGWSNRNTLYLIDNTAANVGLVVLDSNVSQVGDQTGGVHGDFNRTVVISGENNFRLVNNGWAIDADTSATRPTTNIIRFGSAVNDTSHLNGYIRQFELYEKVQTSDWAIAKTTAPTTYGDWIVEYDFEDNSTTGWAGGGNATISIESTNPLDGTYSLRIDSGDAGSERGERTISGFTVGQLYELEMNTVAGGGAAGIRDWTFGQIADMVIDNTEKTKITQRFFATEESGTIRIYSTLESGASTDYIIVDNIKIRPVYGEVYGPNMIFAKDRDFEENSYTSAYGNGSSTTLSIVTGAEAISGNYSLKAVSGDGSFDRLEYTATNLTIGKTYEFECKAKTGGGKCSLQSWTVASIATTPFDFPTDPGTVKIRFVATATSGLIRIYTSRDGSGTNTDFVIVDDLVLREVKT